MSLAQQIKQDMLTALDSSGQPVDPCILVWASNAEEQLDAVIQNSVDIHVLRGLSDLYANALRVLGAPDAENPFELMEWAEAAAKKLKS